MLKKSLFLFILLTFACFAFAKEAEVNPATLSNDMAPNINYNVKNTMDDMWDFQFAWNIQAQTTPDDQLLGGAFDGTYFWVTGGGGTTGGRPNSLYKFTADGTLITFYTQSNTTSWGWRDLCWDGVYLYAGTDASGGNAPVAIIDPLAANPGQQIGQITVMGTGTNFARALCWDPVSDHFYCANFGSPAMEFTRQGVIIRQVTIAGLSGAYGMAWDADAPDGPWIWISDQSGTPQTTMRQLNPATLTLTGVDYTVPVFAGNTAHIAGGCEYTTEYNPQYSTMVVLVQGTPNDAMCGLEMYLMANPWAPGAPTDFTVTNNGPDLIASLDWLNPELCVNGQPLTDLDGVKVYENGALVATVTDVSIGAPYSLDLNVGSVGMYNYEIIAYNDSGDGNPANASAWIGLDVPAAPGSFDVVPDPGGALTATCSWTEPTLGANNGYFPPGSVNSYTLYRAPQGQTLVPVAIGITSLNYVDTVPIQGWYDYSVAGVSNSGTGTLAPTVTVYVGPPEFLPWPYNWVEIRNVGINTNITGDDQNLGPFPMGMTFPWYDNVLYNSIRVCSNGWASFTSTSTAYTNVTIPNTAEPNNLVAPLWDDLHAGQGDIWYYYDADSARFIVEWDSVRLYSVATGSYLSFEIIFYPNGNMDFMWKDLVTGTGSLSATVGIENGTGTVGTLLSFNGGGPINPVPLTGARIFAVGIIPVYDIDVELVPYGTPIVIPPGGGTFNYDVTVTNEDTVVASNFNGWIMVTLPDGSPYGPVLGPVTLTQAPGASLTRNRDQFVPAGAPAGNYTYTGYVGMYPSIIFDESGFPFSKSGVDGSGGSWYNWGESFPGEVIGVMAVTPSEFSLSNAYPNPFNPTTHINYTITEKSLVKLVVYDITGREVATLVNGWIDVGSYEVEFDGANLASGVYFYSLTAGDFSAVKKMLLIK